MKQMVNIAVLVAALMLTFSLGWLSRWHECPPCKYCEFVAVDATPSHGWHIAVPVGAEQTLYRLRPPRGTFPPGRYASEDGRAVVEVAE